MARKTHPISYRLGVTSWWPNRDPININNPKHNRYRAINPIIAGITSKLGIKISQPRIWNKVYASGAPTSQITMLISKLAKNRPVDQNLELPNDTQAISNSRKPAVVGRITEAKGRVLASKSPTIYWMNYLTTLLSTYENRKYICDIREVQEEIAQGTASILSQSVIKNERGIIPSITEVQRKIAFNQAKSEQQRNKK